MIPLLRRVDGLRYLRVSAVAALALFAAFLLVPGVGREARAGRGARARRMPAGTRCCRRGSTTRSAVSSSLVLTVGVLFPLDAVLPLAIAALAGRLGLAVALWPLLLAPGGAAPARAPPLGEEFAPVIERMILRPLRFWRRSPTVDVWTTTPRRSKR